MDEHRVQYFLGANAPDGFYSLYPQLIDLERARAVYILKGGPGCGKSTLMRRVGERMEQAGLETEYILCSGDPDSLDGLVLPQLGVAIVDGTAPHGTAPLGHRTKKVNICKALRRRKYYGSSTRHGTNRTLLQDKLFEVRRNCSIKKSTRYRLGVLTKSNLLKIA